MIRLPASTREDYRAVGSRMASAVTELATGGPEA